jgi:hypothetical protein
MENSMKLLVYYIAISLGLDVVAVFVCLAIEKVVPWASMPIFLVVYFLILWVSWIISVKLTSSEESALQAGAPSDQRA